jgi:ApaG protein
MVTAVTSGVKITVKTRYESMHSNPLNSHHLFSYHITIENLNDFPIRLIRRHWDIYDSAGEFNVVDGEGVVGQQPVIEPFEFYTYNSGCNLKSDFGKMSGYYVMQRQEEIESFKVEIPEFIMQATYKLN